MKRSPKIVGLLERVRKSVELGEYFDSRHFLTRQKERNISRLDVEYVLKSGWHEKQKDSFDMFNHTWNYSLRGLTVDPRELRVVVSYDARVMMIITAIDLDC